VQVVEFAECLDVGFGAAFLNIVRVRKVAFRYRVDLRRVWIRHTDARIDRRLPSPRLDLAHLDRRDGFQYKPPAEITEKPQPVDLQSLLDHAEREHIINALEKTRWNRTAAAKLLQISFRSMRYRLERLNIE
jgi:transcriptional regulator with GAF, ATPase, and Fis domain